VRLAEPRIEADVADQVPGTRKRRMSPLTATIDAAVTMASPGIVISHRRFTVVFPVDVHVPHRAPPDRQRPAAAWGPSNRSAIQAREPAITKR